MNKRHQDLCIKQVLDTPVDLLDLNTMQKGVWAIAEQHGSHEERYISGALRDASPGERLALIAAEVGEAVQALQKEGKVSFYREVDGKPEGVIAEVADIVIRCLDMAEHYGFNLGSIIQIKSAYNNEGPHRHLGEVL